MESVSISLLKSLPPPVVDFICFRGYCHPPGCFRPALELHFYWNDFISIINEVRNYAPTRLVQSTLPHANSWTG